MKYFFLLIVIFLVVLSGLYYFKPTLFHSLHTSISGKIATTIDSLETATNKTTIYKWTDANGILQVSNTAPPAGIKYHIEELEHSKNIVPSNRLTGTSKK